MLAFHMYCAETSEKAAAIARAPLNMYLRSIVDAASEWMSGVSSKRLSQLSENDRGALARKHSSRRSRRARLDRHPGGYPQSIDGYDRHVGGFESASLQVNFGMIDHAEAEQSMRLFAREVMPYFARTSA